MNTVVLSYLNNLFLKAGINYSFLTKNGPVEYPYFVGDYVESPEATESGEMKLVFNLNGWNKGSWLELEEIKEKLADAFRCLNSIVDGYGVSLSYSDSTPIPVEDAELKRIQISFEVHIWRCK